MNTTIQNSLSQPIIIIIIIIILSIIVILNSINLYYSLTTFENQNNNEQFMCGIQPNEIVKPKLQPNIITTVEDMSSESKVADASKNKLVLYYTNWCGHSKNFLPIWEQIKQTASENNIYVTEQYDCVGYPTPRRPRCKADIEM